MRVLLVGDRRWRTCGDIGDSVKEPVDVGVGAVKPGAGTDRAWHSGPVAAADGGVVLVDFGDVELEESQ